MNVRWARSNEIVLSLLAIAMVAVGTLTALVVHEQYDQSTPATAITPDHANAPAIPAPGVAPVPPAPQMPPASDATPTPQLNPAPLAAPVAQRSRQSKTHPQRRAHPVPAPVRSGPDRPASVYPAIPAPAAEPATGPAAPVGTPESGRTPRKVDNPAKSAIPTGSSEVNNSETPQNYAPARTPTKDRTADSAAKPTSPATADDSHAAGTSTPGPAKARTSNPPWIPGDVGAFSPARTRADPSDTPT